MYADENNAFFTEIKAGLINECFAKKDR